MIQKHRIRTEIGKDHKVTVELKQDYDLLEILSLKFTQQDIYTSICADYGVICGRITANQGYGVANARVSIFIPLDEVDEEDPVVSALYPYKSTQDTTTEGYKYNLFPKRKQHTGHEENQERSRSEASGIPGGNRSSPWILTNGGGNLSTHPEDHQ